jgi:U3 small nucleolar RNA-associated protein 5
MRRARLRLCRRRVRCARYSHARLGDDPRRSCALTRLPAAPGSASVLVARGSVARATFERVVVDADSDDVVALAPSAKGLLLDSAPATAKSARAAAAAAAAAAATATVHGADNAVDAVLPRPAENGGGGRKHAAAAHANGGAASDDDVAMPLAAPFVPGEQTLGDRLRALELAAGAAVDAPALPGGAARPGEVPRADSLAVLLTQALASSDGALLERVLSVSDRKVAANTVARLRPEQALAFLAAAVARLQASPARGARLAHWIRETLAAHAGYLTAAPGAAPLLAALYGVLDARLALYRPLLALSGRLDLLLAAQRRTAGAAGAAAAGGASAPQVEYTEPDGDEPEDARGGGGSDDEDDEEEEDEDAEADSGLEDSDGMGDLGEEGPDTDDD